MPLTFEEVKESIVQHMDEVAVCELLNLTSEDLVNTFSHRIETLWLNGRLDTWIGEDDLDDHLCEPD